MHNNFLIDKRYRIDRYLGCGAYGEVCRGIDTRSGKPVAVKRTHEVFKDCSFRNNMSNVIRTYREIKLLRRLNHHCVISLFDVHSERIAEDPDLYQDLLKLGSRQRAVFEKLDDFFLIFELMETDLKKFLDRRHTDKQNLLVTQVQSIFYQTLIGLKFIHSANVINRDIKPENILIKRIGDTIIVKLADFGLARVIHRDLSGAPVRVPSDPEFTTPRSPPLHQAMDHFLLQSDSHDNLLPGPPAVFSRAGEGTGFDGVALSHPSGEGIGFSGGSLCSEAHSDVWALHPPIDDLVPKDIRPPRGALDASSSSSSSSMTRQYTREVATLPYRAPEIWLAEEYDAGVDVWSAGCVFWELLGDGPLVDPLTPPPTPCRSLSPPGAPWRPLATHVDLLTFLQTIKCFVFVQINTCHMPIHSPLRGPLSQFIICLSPRYWYCVCKCYRRSRCRQ